MRANKPCSAHEQKLQFIDLFTIASVVIWVKLFHRIENSLAGVMNGELTGMLLIVIFQAFDSILQHK